MVPASKISTMHSRTYAGINPFDEHPIEVTVREGIVEAIRGGARSPEQREEDWHDRAVWLSPGFVDLQVNGYGGDDINVDRPAPEMIVSLTRKMLATGVTTYLPTIITAPEEKIITGLQAIAKARHLSKDVLRSIPFVHIEGPCISDLDGYRGAHPREYVRPPSVAEFRRWQAASAGLVGMVTLSPHYPGAEEYIAELTSMGVHVAIGHTHATAEQISRAVAAGARLSTHLGNGIANVLPRHLNPIWAQLADDRLTATVIADGHHLPNSTLKSILRAKGVSRSVLVSDAVALAGMPAGIYDTPVGGRVELNTGGRLSLAGTEMLAGAALPLKDGIARASMISAASFGDCVLMATENPGKFAGGAGTLRVGDPAQLVRFQLQSGGTGLHILNAIAHEEVFSVGES
jgi:N-acetylglucosamine-6-phosphate deacetylase